MKEITLQEGNILAPFFKEAYDSCPEAFLQGVMGRGFCDSTEDPTYGIIQMGDYCYLGGDGSGSQKKNLLSILFTMLRRSHMIMVPLSESWNQQFYQSTGYQKVTRYALNRPNPQYFNKAKLTAYISNTAYDPNYAGANVSRRFIVKPIDEAFYYLLQKQDWSHSLTQNYANYAAFSENGFGFVIIEGINGKIASIASSFCTSLDSVEIEIATSPHYRRKGLATAVSARMVLECLTREKQPCWDASNLISVTIAEKLGYHLSEEYISYEIYPSSSR
ncbi:MAG: GNAT family N-acetyltransferase [Lachnospiraceae bacterium]|nr:GNAT family N-acetyltransferase [Lachnospiraceae bacterium]